MKKPADFLSRLGEDFEGAALPISLAFWGVVIAITAYYLAALLFTFVVDHWFTLVMLMMMWSAALAMAALGWDKPRSKR